MGVIRRSTYISLLPNIYFITDLYTRESASSQAHWRGVCNKCIVYIRCRRLSTLLFGISPEQITCETLILLNGLFCRDRLHTRLFHAILGVVVRHCSIYVRRDSPSFFPCKETSRATSYRKDLLPKRWRPTVDTGLLILWTFFSLKDLRRWVKLRWSYRFFLNVSQRSGIVIILSYTLLWKCLDTPILTPYPYRNRFLFREAPNHNIVFFK